MAGPPRKNKSTDSARAITADLVAVLVAVTDGEPKIMTIANAAALPSGPFEFKHRSLQSQPLAPTINLSCKPLEPSQIIFKP